MHHISMMIKKRRRKIKRMLKKARKEKMSSQWLISARKLRISLMKMPKRSRSKMRMKKRKRRRIQISVISMNVLGISKSYAIISSVKNSRDVNINVAKSII